MLIDAERKRKQAEMEGQDNRTPTATLQKPDELGNIKITFSKPMQIIKDLEKYIKISVDSELMLDSNSRRLLNEGLADDEVIIHCNIVPSYQSDPEDLEYQLKMTEYTKTLLQFKIDFEKPERVSRRSFDEI